MSSRRGFTMIELLVVLIFMGILASIALLKYIDLRNEAETARVAGEMHAIRVAAFNYYADQQTWPPDGAAGAVPPALAPYLPGGFSFTYPKYQLDFENVPGGGGTGVTIGVTLTTSDPSLLARLQRRLGTSTPYILLGGNLTYVIVDGTGVF
jgi:MSHA pilin protein MshA